MKPTLRTDITVATQETATGWRCEGCGDLIAGPPKAAQVLDA